MSRYTSMNSLSDECAFCLESIDDYDYATLNCGHRYHLRCIQEWVKTTNKQTKLCPQCNIHGEIMNIQSGKKSEDILIKDQSYNIKSMTIDQPQSAVQPQTHLVTTNQRVVSRPPKQRTSRLAEIEDEVSYICCNIL